MKIKNFLQITLLLLMINAANVSFGQPPPPPPDPDGTGTAPYPPGWVGKSPVGDGYLILIALGLAYSMKKYMEYKKRKTAETE